MKKYFTLLLLLLATFGLSAQQMVSTTPQKRNVLLEEFTGINCQNCPSGHMVANQLTTTYPDRAWSVNIHSGYYAPTYYPNFNTDDGGAIANGFNISAWPQGVVNRSTAGGVGRTEWMSYASTQLEQNAECNVAGQAFIDIDNRTATITLEIYYTANSSSTTNYINVIMLQDNIMGPQSGGSTNSSQYENGQYRHMHAFRDAITPTWGEAISPTTAGTLITKTYTYDIPYTIGSPNGISVDLDDIYFIAFVTERHQDVPTRPILNVNKLSSYQGSNQEIYPYMSGLSVSNASCSGENMLDIIVNNGGTHNLTTIDFQYFIDGTMSGTYSWEGVIASHDVDVVSMPVQIPVGEHEVMVKIVEANGQPFDDSASVNISIEEWIDMPTSPTGDNFIVEIMQDKYGNQITWELVTSDNTTIASGGPYDFLSGSSATQLHQENVHVQAGDCLKFVIHDAGGNGICCQFGNGYYRILNSDNDVIVDGSGEFGSEASHVLSVSESETHTESITAEICEGDDYTEYGFQITSAEAGIYEEQSLYNGILYLLTLTVIPNPDVIIEGNNQILQGENTILTASGADTYLWSTGETSETITVSPEETTIYSVTGSKDGCEAEANITIYVVDGIDDEINLNTNIYPNPVTSELNIICSDMQKISVFRPNGQIVDAIYVEGDTYTLKTDSYCAGLYFVQVTTREKLFVCKIVKQ